MGPMVIIVTAILTVSAGNAILSAVPHGILPELIAFTLDKMEYS